MRSEWSGKLSARDSGYSNTVSFTVSVAAFGFSTAVVLPLLSVSTLTVSLLGDLNV